MKNDNTFTPQQVSNLAITEVKKRKEHKVGVRINLPGLKNDMLPMRPGELIPIMGNTSNFKSGLMMNIMRNSLPQFVNSDKVAIYVTWEQSVEEHGMMELASMSKISAEKMAKGELDEDEWKILMRAAIRRATKPLWLVGHSAYTSTKRPRLCMTDVTRACEFIVSEGKSIGLIALDYVQRIRPEGGRTRREQIMEIVDKAKDMALSTGCPVLLGTQAGRQVMERGWKLPQLQDAQETSNLEQSADKFLSVWMPKTTEPIGSILSNGLEVSENLLLVGLLKQRYGVAPRQYAFFVKPEVNEIYSFSNEENTNGKANNETPIRP